MRHHSDLDGPGSLTPTVVVSRRPRPGAEVAFESWLTELSAAAGRAPGHLGVDVQRPSATHPGEWVIVYRFATSDQLQAWLADREREALLARGQDLVEGPAREQVVAVRNAPEPVTAVSSVRLRPGSEEVYRTHHRRIVRALAATPGFRRAELLEPVDGAQDEVVTVMVFDDRRSLQTWLDSDVRRDLLAAIEPLVLGERALNVVGGYAGWFAPGEGAQVMRWKQALTVLLALFPVSLAVGAARAALLPGLPLVPSILLGNVIGVTMLSWVLMPFLTRHLDRWLRR